MPSGAGPGTTRGRWPAASPSGVAAAPPTTPRRVPATRRPASSKAPATRCGRTPKTSTERQTAKLAWIAKTDTRLYRAYLLKEGLRHVFSVKGEEGKQALDRYE